MTETDPFESELRRLKPAHPPAALLERLSVSRPAVTPQPDAAAVSCASFWPLLLRWILPAAALVMILLFVKHTDSLKPVNSDKSHVASTVSSGGLKADDVQIDRELVASFDAVARLPGGEPVRFQCREWIDQVVWQDKARAVKVQQRTPRVEIIPVRFETY